MILEPELEPVRPARTGLLSDPWRFIRFGLVGGTSTVIYAVLAWLFTIHIGMPAVVGSIALPRFFPTPPTVM
jgi:hypothetical protein